MDDNQALMSILNMLSGCVMGKVRLLKCILRMPSGYERDVLMQRCGSLSKMEHFLAKNQRYIMVENDEVCLYNSSLIEGREGAVTYYSDILRTYVEPCNFINLRGHIGQANENIRSFINTFYPKKDFKDFLLAHPESFVFFDDDTVHQVQEMEERSVEFFRNCLEKFGGGFYYEHFRGHYTHSTYVRQYIQQYYPEIEDFLTFLQNNDAIFDLEDGYVYPR